MKKKKRPLRKANGYPKSKKGTFPCSFAALFYKLFERCQTMISTLNTTLDMGLRCHLVDCNMENCKDLKGSSVSSTTSMPPAMPAPNTGRRYWDKQAWLQNFLNNPEDACIFYFFEFLWLELAVAAFASCFLDLLLINLALQSCFIYCAVFAANHTNPERYCAEPLLQRHNRQC